MAKVNGCQKGKAGERELAELFRGCGVGARRGRQFSGSPDSPDVVTDLSWLHIESKRTENLQLYAALDQAAQDAGPDQLPAVFHRRNGRQWVAIVDARAFILMARRGQPVALPGVFDPLPTIR